MGKLTTQHGKESSGTGTAILCMKMTIKMHVLKPGNEVRGWIGAERVDTEKGSQKMERCATSADITQTPILRITGNVRNIYIQRRRQTMSDCRTCQHMGRSITADWACDLQNSPRRHISGGG